MATENKVQFGLRNVHYAVWNGTTYETPVAVPGAVNLTLDHEGETNKFYADDIAYFVTNTNNGYSGDLEIAKIPDQMLQDIFGYKLTETDKVLQEDPDAVGASFALMYQVAGDQHNTCFLLYSCTASLPAIGSQTKEETTEVRTQTITLTAVPRSDGKCFAKTTADTPSTVIENWFKSVYGAST